MELQNLSITIHLISDWHLDFYHVLKIAVSNIPRNGLVLKFRISYKKSSGASCITSFDWVCVEEIKYPTCKFIT